MIIIYSYYFSFRRMGKAIPQFQRGFFATWGSLRGTTGIDTEYAYTFSLSHLTMVPNEIPLQMQYFSSWLIFLNSSGIGMSMGSTVVFLGFEGSVAFLNFEDSLFFFSGKYVYWHMRGSSRSSHLAGYHRLWWSYLYIRFQLWRF